MKHLCFLLILVLTAFNYKGYGQEQAPLSSISFSVVMPTEIKGIPSEMLPLLESKITDIITMNGISATGLQSFIVYPSFTIYNSQEAPGMRTVTIITGNLTLSIKQTGTNLVFSSYSKQTQGSGTSKSEALQNIFSTIIPSDDGFTNFINTAKTKIVSYYVQNCSKLLQKAESERMTKNYEASLATLLTIPTEAESCYPQAQAKAKTVFSELEKYNCGRYLQEAKAYAAGADYEHALQRLSWIDPSTTCNKEAIVLIKQISEKVDENVKKRWDYTFRALDGQIELQKAQYQVMTNLTAGWLLNQSRASSFNNVIIK